MRHSSDICEPYEFEKENATTGEIEIIKKLSDSLGGSDRSLLKLVKAFLSQTKRGGEGDLANQTSTGAFDDGAQVVIDEDEDQNDEQEEIETVSDGTSTNEEGTMEHFNSELQAQQQVTAEFLRSKKNKKQSKWREWRMDMLRLDDFNQMRLMQKELVKLRKAKEKKRNGGASKTRQAAEYNGGASVQRPMSAVPNQGTQVN